MESAIVRNLAGVELVETHDSEQIEEWQRFQASTLPSMISAMQLCHVLQAMVDTGLADRLRGGVRTVESGLLGGLNRKLGEQLLQYLVLRGVLDEWQGEYTLTTQGMMLTSKTALARLGLYMEAYGPVVSATADLLSERSVYGVDVQRASGPLSRHSGAVFARYYTPIVLEAMRDSGARRLLDLGCGGGQLLVDACLSDPEISGVGIDIAPGAIEVAQDRARRHDLQDRLQFAVADAFEIDSWPQICHGADALCGVGVLHELFRDGDQAVIDTLNGYDEFLATKKMFLIGEPELYYDDRENDSDFFLVHALTNQGIPRDREGWLEIFERTNLTCRRVYTRATAGPRTCFYDLRSPRS